MPSHAIAGNLQKHSTNRVKIEQMSSEIGIEIRRSPGILIATNYSIDICPAPEGRTVLLVVMLYAKDVWL
jgi:hypothetical protein